MEEFVASQAVIVSTSSDAAVMIPSGASKCEGGTSPKIASVTYKALSYSWAMGHNQVRDSPVYSVSLYCGSVKQIVENLDPGIRLELKVRSKRGLELLTRLSSGEITEKQAIDAGFF